MEREKGWRREKGCGGEKGRKDVLGNFKFIVLSKSLEVVPQDLVKALSEHRGMKSTIE